MNQKRQAKLKKRADDQHRRDQKKHDLAMNALRHAGVYEAFHRLPQHLQAACLSLIQPAPEIVLHESATDSEHARGLQRGFAGFLGRFISETSRPTTPVEFYCFLWPLHLAVDMLVKDLQQKKEDLQAAPACHIVALVSQLQGYMEQQSKNMENDYVGATWTCLLYNSIYDERILWAEFKVHSTPGGRITRQVEVHRTTPERVRIAVEDRPRPAFRCCTLIPTGGLNEVAWTGREIGFPADDRTYPVYMQSHVLEQFQKRVPCSRIVYPIMTSLMLPKFLRAHDNHFLVEVWHLNYKLGYFVALRLEDRILLKTFLFLTMQGTPESDLLYHKLHLTRRDIEYLKLDELAAFRDPEVRHDPTLVKLLNDCGCGHLLTLTASDLPQEIPTGYADPLRKYLGTNDKPLLPMPLPPINPSPTDPIP